MSSVTSLRTRKASRANSVGVKERADRVRQWHPVIVTGVSFKERRLISPQNYGMIDVDPSYQRGKTTEVPAIVAALQAGGIIPDTVDLAERAWGPRDGKLWIMDGLQRVCALQELNMPFSANVHVTESLAAERSFFLAMNNRRSLNSNTQVRAWDGPVTALLLALNSQEDSSLRGRIEFQLNGGDRISAAVLVRGIERLLSGKRGNGDIQKILSRCDKSLTTSGEKLMATMYCRLVNAVFPKGYAPTLPALSLAEVGRERWLKGKVELPTKGVVNRLVAINWRTALPGQSQQYLDFANSIVRRYWKK